MADLSDSCNKRPPFIFIKTKCPIEHFYREIICLSLTNLMYKSQETRRFLKEASPSPTIFLRDSPCTRVQGSLAAGAGYRIYIGFTVINF